MIELQTKSDVSGGSLLDASRRRPNARRARASLVSHSAI
jgi:hypothetical protein